MSFTLTNHYRAISEQLIYFSNHYFYNDQLLCISKNGEFTKAVDVYDVNGVYDRENGINIEEADKVVTILNELIPRFKTAIVVTFNAKQADLIRNKCLSSPLSPMIENLNIKVRSLENVQGDEANIVIISTTFGKDKNNKFIQNFGPVNQDGGKNRINVMASRAKERMVVVKSFSAADIDNIHNENTLIFKNFIAYVEQIQLNNDITKPDIINQTANVNHAIDIAQEIVNELLAHDNYIIQQNHKIGSHVVNIAVTKKDAPRIAICILIDTSQD
jgi:superfamily I DNA and/or RNA helicase